MIRCRPAAAIAMALVVFGASAAEKKRIYIANDDHTDYMWTADSDTYHRVFVEMLDFHLKLADETASNPEHYRNRFNADGSLWLWAYEQKKSAADFDRLMARLKDGTITAPLNPLVLTYGGQPLEAVLRGMYYSGRLERRFNMRFPLALAMENQTLPLGLASLFAGSGAQYSWRGICACASKILERKPLNERKREVYWWTGHDDQRLLLKWYSYGPNHLGSYLECGESLPATVQYVDADPGFLRRHADMKTGQTYEVVGLFGFGGDDLARKTGEAPPPEIPGVPGLHKVIASPRTEHFHVMARELSNVKRQLIVSNELDYFRDFEKTHGSTLETQKVTFGNEWDLYTASMAETSARVRRAVEKLRAAELLASLVSLKYPGFMRNHGGARDRAYQAMGLFYEHNWTADGPISRAQRAGWQDQVASDIEAHVNGLYGEALIRLGGMIPRPEKAQRFFVMNPLGWPRTDAADFAWTGDTDIHVRDLATGKDVPHQIVSLQGAQYLRILATDIPAAGYKVFEVNPGPGNAPSDDAAAVSGAVFENDRVKLVIERDGAIRSFIDKQRNNAELAAAIGGLKVNDLAASSDEGEELQVENRGPVSVTVRARSAAGLNHTTAVTLFRGSDRVDIRNEIDQNFQDVRHWTFSFDLQKPSLRTEEVGAVNLNRLQSEGGAYSNTHARYDYATVNHFADFTDGSGSRGVTLSNADLAFGRMGESTPQKLDTTTPQLHMLAGGQVDGPRLGIPAQNGQTRFLQRFALRAHGAYDQTAAMKFALEHQNALVTGAVISEKNPTPYPETSWSLLTTEDPNVLLWSVKPHDDGIGQGLVARFWNVADAPARTNIRLTGGAATAYRTTHIETDLEAVPVTAQGTVPVSFTRQQIQTYRVLPKQ